MPPPPHFLSRGPAGADEYGDLPGTAVVVVLHHGERLEEVHEGLFRSVRG